MAKTTKQTETPIVEKIVTNEPIVEEPIVKVDPPIVEDIIHPLSERISQLEEMLKWKWSGWRTQKLKKELEDLKSSM